MEADMKWYVIHTYSGYENKVLQNAGTEGQVHGFGKRHQPNPHPYGRRN